MENTEVVTETTAADLFKEAAASAKKDSTPSEAHCAEELLAAGWKPVHASPFWKAPNGAMFPGVLYSWQCLQQGHGKPTYTCSFCGQQLPATKL
jgi:hypothetical protein